MGRGVVAVVAVVLTAALGVGLARRAGSVPRIGVATAAAALPQTDLALGVTASPGDLSAGGWVAESAVPWTYAYQYLAGGANTGSGWETWNSQGQFPIYYAEAAQAQHVIPVFSYYMLLQSNGPCGTCSEAQKDLAHLDDPSTMSSWYQDFTTLMKRLGGGAHDGVTGYGGPAIVHVEPDLSGYAEQAVLDPTDHCFGFCTGADNDPAT